MPRRRVIERRLLVGRTDELDGAPRGPMQRDDDDVGDLDRRRQTLELVVAAQLEEAGISAEVTPATKL